MKDAELSRTSEPSDTAWLTVIGKSAREEDSMSRKVVRLTVDNFSAIAAPCRSCLLWELDPVRRARVAESEAATEKQAWISWVLRDWGSCGRVIVVNDIPVGYLMYAPPAYVPGANGFPTAPVSPDAVLLTTAYIEPKHRGGGLARMLVQGMARDLIGRGGIRAVECFADARIKRLGGKQPGLLPEAFLGSVGFKTQRAHPTTPRMRMDLTSALTWRDELEIALERLVRAVRPVPEATRQIN
jgi:GNAT superfamily N-acetyltransferase